MKNAFGTSIFSFLSVYRFSHKTIEIDGAHRASKCTSENSTQMMMRQGNFGTTSENVFFYSRKLFAQINVSNEIEIIFPPKIHNPLRAHFYDAAAVLAYFHSHESQMTQKKTKPNTTRQFTFANLAEYWEYPFVNGSKYSRKHNECNNNIKIIERSLPCNQIL